MPPLRDSGRTPRRMTVTLPAPVGGLNLRDVADGMPLQDALVMDNFIPRESYCELRRGHKLLHACAPAKTLLAYNAGAVSELLFASEGKIYRADFNGKSPVEIKGSFGSDYWSYTQYKGRLFMANGAGPVQIYDGKEIESATFTTQDGTQKPQSLVHVCLYKKRLFFVEDGTLRVWYTSAAGNIGGELKALDFDQFCKRGGQMLACACWTQDGGEGSDDQLLFITSEGEVLVYSGTDPSDANAWAQKGIFQVPRPVGRRCTEQLGGDVLLITQEGYFPLSQLLAPLVSNRAVAFSNKINPAVKDLRSQFVFTGWEMKYYSAGSLLVCNVPLGAGKYVQYVMNTATGAWCRFTGMNAYTWETVAGALYFAGNNGNIYQADTGSLDDARPVRGELQQAYNAFGSAEIKNFKELQITISTNLDLEFVLLFGVDFKPQRANYVSSFDPEASYWDKAKWDEGRWDADNTTKLRKVPVFCEPGTRGSVGIVTETKAGDVRFYGWNVAFERGLGMI